MSADVSRRGWRRLPEVLATIVIALGVLLVIEILSRCIRNRGADERPPE